jgi:hypothetical protein
MPTPYRVISRKRYFRRELVRGAFVESLGAAREKGTTGRKIEEHRWLSLDTS